MRQIITNHMKRYIFVLLLLIHVCICLANQINKPIFIVEAEDFQFSADWSRSALNPYMDQKGLYVRHSNSFPMTVFNMQDAGEYILWASVADFKKDNPGSRTITVSVNQKPIGIAGKHGEDGFKWERLGSVFLDKGDNLISIKNNIACARADAFLFSKDKSFDPNKQNIDDAISRKKYIVKPEIKKFLYSCDYPRVGKLSDVDRACSFEISNGAIKIKYTQKMDSAGRLVFERSENLNKDGKWTGYRDFPDEVLMSFYSPKSEIYLSKYFFKWNNTKEKMFVELNGKMAQIGTAKENPFLFGEMKMLRPVNIRKVSERELKLDYDDGIKAKISLDKKLPVARFDVSRIADKNGYFSFGFLGFNSVSKDGFNAVEMPTVYQERRTMSMPHLVPSSLLSHPLCMVEVPFNGISVSSGLVALPEKFTFQWPHFSGSPYAFCLSTPDSKYVQSSIFSPVLGLKNSKRSSGEVLESSFFIISVASDWKDFLELVDTKIFDITRFREAYGTSFSDTICNIAEYLKNSEFSGWSKELKGRWNIEGQNVVTQSTPLTEISLSILTEDEDAYAKISLPTFEYLLSRRRSHYTPYLMPGHNYFDKNCTKLEIPSPAWHSDTYAGADWLLGGANLWIEDFFRECKIKINNWNRQPEWTADLGLYLARPNDELLKKVVSKADAWLENGFRSRSTADTNMDVFINVKLYPYWWYLPDLYEITGDRKYLEAAEEGAFHSMSSLMVYPLPPEGEVEIYKGNKVAAYTHNMWKGIVKDKVGREVQEAAKSMLMPDKERSYRGPFFIMPQKKVDAFKVSRVGYGIEQHCTYVGGDRHVNNILMSSWAPEMLRVYGYTGKDVLMKMSRHSMIGRFANFFGYYQRDFQDATLDPLYPYRGPDITCLYYHHAPCQFAAALDYFMAQIEIASKGAIKFPYVRQQGYVWFIDRIFGRPGRVLFDNNCKPILSKNAARTDNPKVSVMLARADDGMWVLLYNDSQSASKTTLVLDASDKVMRGVLVDKPISIYDMSSRKIGERKFHSDAVIDMKPLEMLALKIPADYSGGKPFSYSVNPVSDGHRVFRNLPDGFGDLHVFRIRSPFGKDGIYIVSTGQYHGARCSMNISIPGLGVETSRREYPYEVSVYPVGQESKQSVKIELVKDGKLLKSIDVSDL